MYKVMEEAEDADVEGDGEDIVVGISKLLCPLLSARTRKASVCEIAEVLTPTLNSSDHCLDCK